MPGTQSWPASIHGPSEATGLALSELAALETQWRSICKTCAELLRSYSLVMQAFNIVKGMAYVIMIMTHTMLTAP